MTNMSDFHISARVTVRVFSEEVMTFFGVKFRQIDTEQLSVIIGNWCCAAVVGMLWKGFKMSQFAISSEVPVASQSRAMVHIKVKILWNAPCLA